MPAFAKRPKAANRVASRTPAQAAPLPPFERVVAELGPDVLRFCAAQAGRDRAEDVFQETMLAALRAYEQLRDPAAIKTWLFSIAARKAIDAHRAAVRGPEPTDAAAVGTAGEDAAPPDEKLWDQVRSLPAKQRAAVTLRYRGDLTHAEIAVVMGGTEVAARRNVFEGLERLRRMRVADRSDLTT